MPMLRVLYAAGDQWPGSRAVAIEKANTADALSLPNFAFSTANLYSGAQPGGYLYGIVQTNPVDTLTMYAGEAVAYGISADPMVGKKASGVVTFGGLALYGARMQRRVTGIPARGLHITKAAA